jgi:hypothetical protein
MDKKQIRAIETPKAAADNARRVGLTGPQIEIIMQPDVTIDRYLEVRKRVFAPCVEEPDASPKVEPAQG